MFNSFTKIKNDGIQRRKYSLYFAMLALIISAASFLLLSEKYKQYDSEISIIFIPKSELAAEDGERIIGNMEILPTKMFFYDRMAKYDGTIKNKITSSANVKVSREKESSILKISALAENQNESIKLSKTAVTNLFNILGFYYDIKEDADFRIIEGPITHASITDWSLLLTYSLLAGTLSFLAMNFVFKNIAIYPKREKRDEKETSEFFEISKSTKTKTEITREDDVYEIKSKPPIVSAPSEKKSPAPPNLPSAPGELTFIDEEYFRTKIIKGAKIEPSAFVKTTAAKEIVEEPSKETPIEASIEASMETSREINPVEPVDFHREPTPEELKKRLNQLLRGEL